MSFSLATLALRQGHVGALEIGDEFWPLDALRGAGAELHSADVKGLLEQWALGFPQLEKVARDCVAGRYRPDLAISREQARLDVAVRFPNKLIAVGANYASHLSEMGLPIGKWDPMPFFLKPPTTCMVGPGETIRAPRDSQQFDWEIELAVVMGERLEDAPVSRVVPAIAAYSIGLDLSARDLVAPKNQPSDFVRGKGQDTMAPFGPSILPAKFIDDPHNLTLTLDVNSRRFQSGSTSEMIYRIEEQISIMSRFITIEPGDVIFTGTPAGSGKMHGIYLQPGDRISAEIRPIGRLDVQVRR